MQRLQLVQNTSPHLLSSFCLTGLSACLPLQDQLCVLPTSVTTPAKISHSLFLPFHICFMSLCPLTLDFSIIISGGFTYLYLDILSHFNLLVQASFSYSQPSGNFHTTNKPGFTLIRCTWYPSAAALCLFGNSTWAHVFSKRCVSQWPPLLCSSCL